MHKLTRYSAAVLLSLSMASAGMMTAYADQTVDYSQIGPGFADPQAEGESGQTTVIRTDSDANSQEASGTGTSETAAAGEGTGETTPTENAEATTPAEAAETTGDGTQAEGQEPTAQETPAFTFTSDEEAAMRAYLRTQEFGETIPYIAASALRNGGFWTPSFIGDDTIHNLGNGWYSIQMILTII